MIRGDVRPYLDHNPVARAVVSLLLVLLVLQAATGLILAGTDIYYPPFGHWIAAWIAAPGVDPSTIVPYDKTGIDPASWEAMRAFRAPIVSFHFWKFCALLAAIVIHIVGVVVDGATRRRRHCLRYVHGPESRRPGSRRRSRTEDLNPECPCHRRSINAPIGQRRTRPRSTFITESVMSVCSKPALSGLSRSCSRRSPP